MTGRFWVCMIVLGCAVGVAPLDAGTILGDPTGLTSPAMTINFTEFGIPDGTAVTDQYAGLGVIFSAGMYQATGAVANFAFGSPPNTTSPFSVHFTSPQSSATVDLVTNLGTSSFDALLGGTLVDSFSVSTGAQAYYGFRGQNFDEIRITPGGLFDVGVVVRVQVGTIPEPSGFTLLGGGLLGLLVLSLKRRN